MKRKKKAPLHSTFAAWRFLVGAFLARTLCLEVIQIFASLVSNKARKRLCSVPLFHVHNRQPHCIPNVWQGHTSRWPMELSNANCDSPLASSSPVLSLGRILYGGRPRRLGLALLAAFAGKWPEHNRFLSVRHDIRARGQLNGRSRKLWVEKFNRSPCTL